MTLTDTWSILTTPAWSGVENMEFDRETLSAVIEKKKSPTLRFFRWKEPTLSYGRLQPLARVEQSAPRGWPVVQRPTGGGIVLHDRDLCISMAWPDGQPGFPPRAADLYDFLHGLFLNALRPHISLSMLACCDAPSPKGAFEERQCFQDPVGADLMLQQQKMLGGALLHRRGGWLYQGSLQIDNAWSYEAPMATFLSQHLCV